VIRKIFFTILVFILAALLGAALCFIYADRVTVFCVNHFTGYEISYDSWGTGPLDRGDIDNLRIKAKKGIFALNAEKVRLELDALALFGKKQVLLDCKMKDVTLNAAREGDASFDKIKALIFDPAQKYRDVEFTLLIDEHYIKVLYFVAHSPDVEVNGDYSYFKGTNEAMIDLKISLSPGLAGKLEEDIRKNVLMPDDDGWYSTVINFRGNATFLRALYSFAVT